MSYCHKVWYFQKQFFYAKTVHVAVRTTFEQLRKFIRVYANPCINLEVKLQICLLVATQKGHFLAKMVYVW